ncbi:alcohol dehydrogenase catalytic domain-containing protein [Pseudomonas fluorescens]
MSDDSKTGQGPANIGRRTIMLAGAGLAAASLFIGARSAAAQTAEPAPLKGPFTVRAYATKGAKSGFAPMQIQRRAVGPKDLLINIEYAGICHSDIHTARSECSETPYPCVPGHEIVGKVAAIGDQVSKFKGCNTGS